MDGDVGGHITGAIAGDGGKNAHSGGVGAVGFRSGYTDAQTQQQDQTG